MSIRQSGSAIRSDRGTQYINSTLETVYTDLGIETELSPPRSPRSNGTAECINRTLKERARTILAASGLPISDYALSLLAANGTRNLSVVSCDTDVLLPYQLFSDRSPPCLDRLHPLGSHCSVKLNEPNEPKHALPVQPAVLVGFEGPRASVYRVRLSDNRIVSTRSVTWLPNTSPINGGDQLPHDLKSVDWEQKEVEVPPILAVTTDLVPETRHEMMKHPQSHEFLEAEKREIDNLETKGTWEIITPGHIPPGTTPISNRWVYANKYDEDGKLMQRKARLVAKGFKQLYGIDFEDTYATTPAQATLRCALAYSASRKQDVLQLNVEGAILQGTLNETIYMQQPEGYHIGPKGSILKLVKPLYGLKQSALCWYEFTDFIFTNSL